MGIWVSNQEAMKWEEIEDRSWNLLIQKSKDLKIFALWVEANINIYGWQGFVFSLEAGLRLVKKFKENLFPENKEEKIYSISSADKAWANAILKCKLDAALLSENYSSELSFWVDFIYQKNKNSEAINKFEKFRNLIDLNTHSKLKTIVENLKNILNDFEKILGFENWQGFKESGIKISQWEQFILNNTPNEKNTRKKDVFNFIKEEDKKIGSDIMIKSREDAFAALNDIVNFLEYSDPQSVVLLLLKKAVAWKKSSLLNIFDSIGDARAIEIFIKTLKTK